MPAKLLLVLFLGLLNVLLPILYLLFGNTTPSHPPSQALPSTHKARVLLIAHGRSGSSFFGGIFNAHPDIFFIYEPLNPLTKITSMTSDAFLLQAERVMQSIVTCSFSDGLYLKKLSLFSHNRASSKPLVSPPFCNTTYRRAIDFVANARWKVCVDKIAARALNEVCRNYSHVFTKILLERLHPAGLSWALHVSGTYSFPVHIVYLVRDPRAMIFSRYRLGWIVPNIRRAHSLVSGEAEEVVETICETMERNLAELLRQPYRMELVRYEDLATKPEMVVKHLFKVLRISPSDEVLSWIRDKSRGPLNNYVFSLSRPGNITLNAWRKTIPVELVSIIENKCQRVMGYLGYIPINGSMALLRAVDKPLFLKRIGNLNMSI